MVKEMFQSSFSYETKGHASLFPDRRHTLLFRTPVYLCRPQHLLPFPADRLSVHFLYTTSLVPAAYDALHLSDKTLVLTLQRAVRCYGTLVEFPVSTRDRIHSTSALPIYNASEQLILENFMTFVRKL